MLFTDFELHLMRLLAEAALPAEEARGLPAGSDDIIFDRLLVKAAPRAARLKQLITASDVAPNASSEALGIWCGDLVRSWTPATNNLLTRLLPLLLQAYYEDHRVQKIYQRRPGPPFPNGYEVEQGDWTLLDDMRERPLLWRGST